MNNSTIFQQILHLIPENSFNSLARKYNADRYVKVFKAKHQLITLLYAQARKKISLRDILIFYLQISNLLGSLFV